MSRSLILPSTILHVPGDVAVCPYCGAALQVRAEGWSEREDGTWEADLLDVACRGEPAIDSPEWEEWWGSHSYMPYLFQMPVNIRVRDWLNANFNFDVGVAND